MNLGEFIIKIGTQGDTKQLDEAIQKLSKAEKETRKQIKLLHDLAKATTDEEKELIRKNAAQQDEIENLKEVKEKQDAVNTSIRQGILTSMKMVGAISATIVALDRMGNSLLKNNQSYITFEHQTGMSINRLNRMSTLAQLSGMNLSPEQVMGDVQSLQQKLFRFRMFGEGADTFAQLGINPMGMKPEQLILGLRKSLRKYSPEIKSYFLEQLGLSQEWLNVLDLADKDFNDYVKQSQELQLSAKERHKLAKYTAQQQKNNMRWELAKQKLLIAIMPMVQQIMDATSKIALKVSNILEQNPGWLKIAKDILVLLAGTSIIKTISAITGMMKSLGALTALAGIGGVAKGAAKGGLFAGLLGATGGAGLAKLAGKKGVGAAAGVLGKRAVGALGGFLGGPLGAIFSILMVLMTFKDLFEMFTKKEDEKENEPIPDVLNEETRYQYHNVKANMTNNFYNNPVPAKEALLQLGQVQQLLLAEKYR